MSDNLNNKAPISVTQPSTAGKGRADLDKSDFDALISQKGYDVYLDKALRCPCRRVSDRQPLSSCHNCGGSGYVYVNRYKTRMVIQSMNISTKFKEWSEERIGTVKITARDEENIAFMDRITLIDAETITSQIIFPAVFDGEFKGKVIYNIKNVDDIFAFEGDKIKLKKLEINTDYTISDNVVVFNSKFTSWDNFTVSIRYRHEPTFHVIDMVRETMTTSIQTANGEKKVVMPVNAVGRRSHYVLDEQNYTGNYIIDNSYVIDGCDTDTILLVDPPTLLRLTHPTSISVILEWGDPSISETNFMIERSGLDGIWSQVAIVAPNTLTYVDTVLQNTTYFYRVATRQNTKQSIWAGPIGLTTNP